ncbi:HAD family hydrolase [Clostridium tarantellae]|uniref:HAD hydrolase-like protein n=1 Tax=Clostridium tarantellae TaxID=39493 RepID=A0A6I1MR05_9CLOT|nr:HAD family hydrolase [Clostridium tarantellae]MPQ44652.1 HAD hydrolase-like protein [Clostridium tarantellae]
MLKEKKYILFDLDGTITNSKLGITKSVQYSLKHFNINVENLDDLCTFIGPPLKDSFMKFYVFEETKALEAISKYREYFVEKGIYENELYENIVDALSILKEKEKTIILATSKPKIFAEKILQHFNLAHYFSYVCGSELDGKRTKKGDVIKHVLKENNITDMNSVIMIGDREHDVIGAKESNIDCIGVLYGFGDYEELSKAGAVYIVNDINELKKLFY